MVQVKILWPELVVNNPVAILVNEDGDHYWATGGAASYYFGDSGRLLETSIEFQREVKKRLGIECRIKLSL